ncbi:zf-HC2 domain-containing protein [Actinoplanes sp. NEAU-A12]|uniref:Zf-HC2 domain-containing protein n=1 Tax=Actinoplanes sandaracinus TaxID=3045177 RepID=A0ABT6WLA8_9ACTN|nr:zf-HC2 domain-containing protein [Actinoplanes sandaracinus]MDI6100504.1 zf-HC2 domain-containing protein [Actinoplanes sandaracinus]
MSDVDEHGSLHRLLGGYLLGGLDEADTERLDEHLHDCAECRAELDRLSPVPEMLQRMPDARHLGGGAALAVSPAARPSSQNIETLLSRMRAEQHKETRVSRVRWLVAASVTLIAAAGVAYGIMTNTGTQNDPSVQAIPSVQLINAQFQPAPGSGLTGEAKLTPKAWGVEISLDVNRISGNGPFLCLVRSRTGATQQAAAWSDTPTGEAKLTGASSTKATDVSAIMITDRDGKVLGTANVV